jgi:pilus assembly protein Flp/PilA
MVLVATLDVARRDVGDERPLEECFDAMVPTACPDWISVGSRSASILQNAELGGTLTEDSLDDPTLAAMCAKLRQFLADENGATAIEYGLIAAGISVAVIAVVNNIGTKLHTTFSSISTQLK